MRGDRGLQQVAEGIETWREFKDLRRAEARRWSRSEAPPPQRQRAAADSEKSNGSRLTASFEALSRRGLARLVTQLQLAAV